MNVRSSKNTLYSEHRFRYNLNFYENILQIFVIRHARYFSHSHTIVHRSTTKAQLSKERNSYLHGLSIQSRGRKKEREYREYALQRITETSLHSFTEYVRKIEFFRADVVGIVNSQILSKLVPAFTMRNEEVPDSNMRLKVSGTLDMRYLDKQDFLVKSKALRLDLRNNNAIKSQL